jgi:hypothetical protein
MITAVIRAHSSVETLAATLTVLIPAVAQGVVGHAVIIDEIGDPALARLADETGAAHVAAGPGEIWEQGVSQARGEWVILLEAGDLPEAQWLASLERHLLTQASRPALMPLRGLAGALREGGSLLLRGRGLRAGLLAPKAELLAGRLSQRPRRLPVGRRRV